MKQDAKDPIVYESILNGLGYRFMGNDQTKIAQDIFKENMMLYPDSLNMHDSYIEASI